MTNDEIFASYRDAADRKMQIRILADLNLCTSNRIIEVLQDCGVEVPKRNIPQKRESTVLQYEDEVRRLNGQGYVDGDIAKMIGISRSSVARVRYACGIGVATGRGCGEWEAGRGKLGEAGNDVSAKREQTPCNG